jgi:hypothetical protein
VLRLAAVVIGFASLGSVAMVAVGAVGACLAAGAHWFLAHRGVLRWLAFAVVIATPIAVLAAFTVHRSAAGRGSTPGRSASSPSQ